MPGIRVLVVAWVWLTFPPPFELSMGQPWEPHAAWCLP